MTNTEIWEWMQRDLDGDLAPEEQRALFALLAKDTDLQHKYNRLKSVSLQLEQLPPVVPSFSIVDSILPKLESAVATPAAKADLNVGVLPTLEVKSKSSSPSESKKWKNKTVWIARIGSTAVAACLLIGVLLVGKEASQKVDPETHGSLPTTPIVEPPTFIGPPAPQPSTNPTPTPDQGEEQPVQENKQPPQQKKTQIPSKPVTNAPEPPPVQIVPPESVPVMLPPKPVPREPKPPAFPYGLEEKSDDHKGKKSVKEDEKEKKKEDKEDDDDDRDDDHNDDKQKNKKDKKDKHESSREYGRTSLA